MKMKFAVWFSAACLVLFLAGCVSTSIEKRFPERWEKTYAGMSVEEFREVWPDAKYNGYGNEPGTEIYSYAPMSLYTFKLKIEFFVFRDNTLERWFEQ